MKKLLMVTLFAAITLLSTGCNNLSPRFDPNLRQKIDNQQGRIDQIENLQNSLKNEMLNLKNDTQIHDSQLDRIQQGLSNQQNNNNGVQILSGTGGLFVGLVGIVAMFIIILHYRQQAMLHEKTADMLAEKIIKQQDPNLEENVFKAAMYTEVEKDVYALLTKHQQKMKS